MSLTTPLSSKDGSFFFTNTVHCLMATFNSYGTIKRKAAQLTHALISFSPSQVSQSTRKFGGQVLSLVPQPRLELHPTSPTLA